MKKKNTKKQKVLAVILGLCMVFVLLAGCGAKDGTKDTTINRENTKEENTKKEDPVALRLIMYGDQGERNTSFFKGDFHDKVMSELNIDISVEIIPWGSYDQLATMLASGEEVAFMCILSEKPEWVTQGLIAPLDEEKLRAEAENVLKARNGLSLDCVKSDGKIYVLPVGSRPFSAPQDNMLIRNDILKAVGWDYTQIKNYSDFLKACEAVFEKFPNMTIGSGPLYKALAEEWGGKEIIWDVDNTLRAAKVNESKPDSDEIINWYESEYFAKYCRLRHDLYERGWITSDYLDNSYADTQWSAGNALTRYGSSVNIYDHELAGVEGADVRYLKIKSHKNLMLNDYDWGWALSAGAAEAGKEETFYKFFNWLYATKDNYLFCLYGVEGTDWEYNENGVPTKLITEDFLYSWQHETPMYTVYPETQYDPKDIAEYVAFDDGAIYSKTIGFSFDTSSVSTEVALLSAIVQEKVKPFEIGILDYDTDFGNVLKDLKDAGLDTYIAEYQKQFSKFMAEK